MKHRKNLFCKSVKWAFSIIAGLSTIAGISGYTVRDIRTDWPWWLWGAILLCVFAALTGVIHFILKSYRHRPYQTIINGRPVMIKTGDLFLERGWKVISFNDRYDTRVDDKVIAHNSMNGVMIDKYVDDIEDLKSIINQAEATPSEFKPIEVDSGKVYPLGRLIPYKEFLLLSFSHFDAQNRAFIDIGEYEQMLFRMWNEMRRIYAAKPIAIPLLGTGMVSIKGISEKNYTEMLKCILCTLRQSGFQPVEGIHIILTKESLDKNDMNIIREEF